MNKDFKMKVNLMVMKSSSFLNSRTYRRIRNGQDGHLGQTEAYDITCTRRSSKNVIRIQVVGQCHLQCTKQVMKHVKYLIN